MVPAVVGKCKDNSKIIAAPSRSEIAATHPPRLPFPLLSRRRCPAAFQGGKRGQSPSRSPGGTIPPVSQPTLPTHTVASVHGDFVEWHRGRRHFAVWAIDLDSPHREATAAALRRHLAPFLLPGYRRQPHVTVQLCGFPGAGQADDDYPPAAWQRHLAALAAAAPGPFAITLGAPASFTTAPYLTVHDDEGGIAALRAALGPDHLAGPDCTYLPHLTVGLYGGRFPWTAVARRLASFPAAAASRIAVTALTLLRYEAAVVAGPLAAIGRFDLAARAWQALDADALAPLRDDGGPSG